MAYPVLAANSPTAGQISWTAFSIAYKGVTYTVTAGSTALAWVAWLYNGGTPLIVTNAVKPTFSATTNGTSAGWAGATPSLGPDDLLLFGNRAGVPMDVQRTQIITGDLVATGTIVTSNIATNAITATQIAANTITANQIAANTITGNLIAANTIQGTNIQGSTITGDKIAAGSITTANLTVGNLAGNQVRNGNFEDIDPVSSALLVWRSNFLGTSSGTSSNTHVLGGTNLDGATSGYLGATSSQGADLTSNAFTVTAGQTYYVSALFQKTAATIPLSLVVTFGATQTYTSSTVVAGVPTVNNVQAMDSSGTVQAGTTSTTSAGTAFVINGWNGGAANTTYTLSGQVTAPTGAKWASVSLVANAGVAGTVYVDDAQFDAVIISAYIANGAIDGRIVTAATIRTAVSGARGVLSTNSTINITGGVSQSGLQLYSTLGETFPGGIGAFGQANQSTSTVVSSPVYPGSGGANFCSISLFSSATTNNIVLHATGGISTDNDFSVGGGLYTLGIAPSNLADNTWDMGTPGVRYRSLYVYNIGAVGAVTLTGGINVTAGTVDLSTTGLVDISGGAGVKCTSFGVTTGSALVLNANNLIGTSSSSKRFKKNITPKTDIDYSVLSLQPITYQDIPDDQNPEADYRNWLGLVAEDVAPIAPLLIINDDKGLPYSLMYDRLAVLLLPIVKDLASRVTALEPPGGGKK